MADTINATAISSYYKNAGVLYRRYHSPDGAMHLPVKITEQESHHYKLHFQARSVEVLIKTHNYKTIVELGCGSGFNSIYLARIFPSVQFIAMDITDANLDIGRRKAHALTNLTFVKFDFNNDTHTYQADLIFAVETFCYSPSLSALFTNLCNCLNVNGRIVVFDGYERLPSQYKKLTANEEEAYRLVCRGFVLRKFQKLQEVYDAMNTNYLIAETEKDYTKEIMPSYKVFQKASLKLLKYPVLTKLLLSLKIIPQVLYLQSLSGFFGAYFFERNFLSYYQFIFKKNSS